MYKRAAEKKLRFQTSRGSLTVEQVMDLNLTDLSGLVKSIKEGMKKTTTDSELDFLDADKKASKEEELQQLRFDIVKDIYIQKKQATIREANKSSNKRQKQEILEEIARRKKDAMKTLSDADLLKMADAIEI